MSAELTRSSLSVLIRPKADQRREGPPQYLVSVEDSAPPYVARGGSHSPERMISVRTFPFSLQQSMEYLDVVIIVIIQINLCVGVSRAAPSYRSGSRLLA
jgi:hypothetical protein